MADQAEFALRNRNPDVLTCIANLSNDEVFTPPEVANAMLDRVADAWADNHDGADIWSDSTLRFLDPFTKSGVFLREVTKRLVVGLKNEIPDLEERVDHILTQQIFGIGITRLTSLLARRSVYCSKHANGKHSIARSLTSEDGNIWFQRTEHSWEGGTAQVLTADGDGEPIGEVNNGRCRFCSAPQLIFGGARRSELETHAYAFIHTDSPTERLAEIFGDRMQFDVVIGNPPYQLAGGAGGSSDSSIYQLFVNQAKSLEPQLLCMVIPSRWLAGGRGLGDFRKEMLGSKRIMSLTDYPVSKDVFPGVEVKGGVCYFLWSARYSGPCDVSVIRGENAVRAIRDLDEFDVFVRDQRAVGILRKVQQLNEHSMMEILTADTPFGIATNFEGFHAARKKGDVSLHFVRAGKRGVGYVNRNAIEKNVHLIDKWKVLVPKAGSDGGQKIPDVVLGRPEISRPPSAATQTFLAFWVDSEEQARSLESYYQTKFFRLLVSLRKLTQDALRPMYEWVPQQTWDRSWTDGDLYAKYGLSDDEVAFIETTIKPMVAEDE